MSTDHNNALSQQQQNPPVHPRPTLTLIQHPNHPSTATVIGTGAVNESLQQQQQQFTAFPATTQVVLSGGITQQQTIQQQPQAAQYVVQNVAPVSFVQSKYLKMRKMSW